MSYISYHVLTSTLPVSFINTISHLREQQSFSSFAI
jgi:hypothetical protein